MTHDTADRPAGPRSGEAADEADGQAHGWRNVWLPSRRAGRRRASASYPAPTKRHRKSHET